MEASEFIRHLGTRFGDFAFHMMEFGDAPTALQFLSSLSFASGSGQGVTFPRDKMEARLFCPPKGPVLVILRGRLTEDQHYEVRKKAKRQASKLTSQAHGDSAMPALAAASQRLKAEEKAKRPTQQPAEAEDRSQSDTDEEAPPPGEARARRKKRRKKRINSRWAAFSRGASGGAGLGITVGGGLGVYLAWENGKGAGGVFLYSFLTALGLGLFMALVGGALAVLIPDNLSGKAKKRSWEDS
jgi:hypothetical protein